MTILSTIGVLPRSRADDSCNKVHVSTTQEDKRRAVLNFDRHFRTALKSQEVIGSAIVASKGDWGSRGRKNAPREQNGSGLTRGAFQAENNPGENAGQRLFQHDAANVCQRWLQGNAHRAERLWTRAVTLPPC